MTLKKTAEELLEEAKQADAREKGYMHLAGKCEKEEYLFWGAYHFQAGDPHSGFVCYKIADETPSAGLMIQCALQQIRTGWGIGYSPELLDQAEAEGADAAELAAARYALATKSFVPNHPFTYPDSKFALQQAKRINGFPDIVFRIGMQCAEYGGLAEAKQCFEHAKRWPTAQQWQELGKHLLTLQKPGFSVNNEECALYCFNAALRLEE